MNKISVQSQDMVLKTKQAQDVYEGKSKNYSFQLGIQSFAGKLSDLTRFSARDNPIKNKILNEIDQKIDESWKQFINIESELTDHKKELLDMGFHEVKIEFGSSKVYSIRFANSRSQRIMVMIKKLDKIVADSLAMENAGMISTKKRHSINYQCQHMIRSIFSVIYKRIDELFKSPGTIELLKVPKDLFHEEIEDFPHKEELDALVGDLTNVSTPVRFM